MECKQGQHKEINILHSNKVPENDIPSLLSPWATALFNCSYIKNLIAQHNCPRVLREKASSFLLDDFYRTPGGIQFNGFEADVKPITLTVEDQDYLGDIEILQEYLEKVRSIVKPGCSREILKAAISSMSSVKDVLNVMSAPLNAELPLYNLN
ncbi:hypothetical protein ABZP36_035399 [Zizania latifolia]